ncbi:unnamed protein product [Polarella glacialis]|uniref:Uncharacterized protein n=1 Tax=Polarella glacialis TaxID=89957 RepID=A0A813L6Y9_POLGL|nr:unnamed protein product [Polarella glacialis]
MDGLRRLVGFLCGKLPGTLGLAGYVACCVLPCKLLFGRCGNAAGKQEDAEEEALIERGVRQVLLLGLDGSGKSSFLWMCEHPSELCLPSGRPSGCAAPPSATTVGVLRLTRKAVQHPLGGERVDLDLCEVGGGAQVRPFWSHYLTRQISVVAYFVDCSAPDRLDEAAGQLAKFYASQRSFPQLLLVASKADSPGAWAPPKVREAVLSKLQAEIPAISELVQFGSLGLRDGVGGRSSADALLGQLVDLSLR